MLPRPPRLPSASALALAAAGALLTLSAGVGNLIGGTQAAFTAQTTNSANAVASLYVQAPTQSAPTSAAGGLVRLTWTASPTAATRAVGYLVYRRPTGGTFTKLTASPITALTYDDTPPTDGTYEYAIQAAVSTFTSPNSNLPVATSDRTAPTITAAGSAGGGLYSFGTWTNLTVTVSFTCADALSGVATCPSSVTVSGEGAGQTVSGTTTDKAGNSRTTTFSPINIDKTAPTGTANLSAASGARNSGAIDLTWAAASDALSGIAGYDVSIAGRSGNTCQTSSRWGSFADVTSGSVTGLTSGTQYCVTLTPRDNASNTGTGATVTARAG